MKIKGIFKVKSDQFKMSVSFGVWTEKPSDRLKHVAECIRGVVQPNHNYGRLKNNFENAELSDFPSNGTNWGSGERLRYHIDTWCREERLCSS